MYLRRCRQSSGGKSYSYWKLMQSVRTARGPRQRVVAYLGKVPEARRMGTAVAAGEGREDSPGLFESGESEFVEVDTDRLRVENLRSFGGEWLAMQLIDRLGL